VSRLLRHGLVDSTSERAFAALDAGEARDGDVHVARGQAAGRGRQGRAWESEEGAGLYLSLVHLPPAPGPAPPAVTMAAGLAVLDALAALAASSSAGPDARLDWPNDVVVGEAKLAGVLIESRGFAPDRPHFVVGIGVNVAQRTFSAELRAERAVTSLALEGVSATPDDLLAPLVPALSRRLEEARSSPATLAEAYLAATGLAGEEVRVRTGRAEVVGRLRAIDLERGLVLETDRGTEAFELAHVRAVDRAPL
jgi:BirA family biotin operon repressor/biotin-[acetyl-CoA-carboxylase] ligase